MIRSRSRPRDGDQALSRREKGPWHAAEATHTNQSNPPIRITTYYIFMQVRLVTVPWKSPCNPPSASRMKQNPRTFLHFQPMPESKTCKTGRGVLLQPWGWDLMALRCTFLLDFCPARMAQSGTCIACAGCLMGLLPAGACMVAGFFGGKCSVQGPPYAWRAWNLKKGYIGTEWHSRVRGYVSRPRSRISPVSGPGGG